MLVATGLLKARVEARGCQRAGSRCQLGADYQPGLPSAKEAGKSLGAQAALDVRTARR